jgi:predicted  nucleic acid-binding Zn-ribbon protein
MNFKEAKRNARKLISVDKLRRKQIKETGKTIWHLPKQAIDGLKKYGLSEREAAIGKKTDRIDEKIADLQEARANIIEAATSDKEKRKAQAYIQTIDEKIEKLRNKKVKISSRGTGVFALSWYALKKVTKSGVGKAKDRIAAAKTRREERREERTEARAEARQEKDLRKLLANQQKLGMQIENVKQYLEGLIAQYKQNEMDIDKLRPKAPEQEQVVEEQVFEEEQTQSGPSL